MLRIIINPACGGKRLGHQSFDQYANIVEKDYVLDLSLQMQTLLTNHGMETSLTRKVDEDTSLTERINMTLDRDVLISNHLNAGKKRGIEIRFSHHNSETFANNLAASFENHGFLVRSCRSLMSASDKTLDYDVILEQSKAKNSVMIFYGYVDSSDYQSLMVGQSDYCDAVLTAIQKTFG